MEPMLVRHFHKAMLKIGQDEAAELDYFPARFLDMVVRQGGVTTAKQLLSSPGLSYGFRKLWEAGRLDLTLEALVIQEPWNVLFTEKELAIARDRLKDCNYNP